MRESSFVPLITKLRLRRSAINADIFSVRFEVRWHLKGDSISLLVRAFRLASSSFGLPVDWQDAVMKKLEQRFCMNIEYFTLLTAILWSSPGSSGLSTIPTPSPLSSSSSSSSSLHFCMYPKYEALFPTEVIGFFE
jgi:hypothetical protein